MFWAITGGIVAGGVGIGALYDFIVGRRGSSVSLTASGPTNPDSVTINVVHDDFNHP